MFYIVDEHGQSLGKYENRAEAIAALEALVDDDPLAVDECAIIEIDGRGKRVGQPITLTVHA
jgi:hypothetical protein